MIDTSLQAMAECTMFVLTSLMVSCRKERFMTNVMGWMTDPKTTQEIREKWFAIWSKADANFGAMVKEKCSGEKAGHPAMAGATKA